MATVWTEYLVSAGRITATDHYPLCVMVGDEWQYIPSGSLTSGNVIEPFKFRLDTAADYIRYYFKASNGTFTFQVLSNNKIIGSSSKALTTEEATYLQVDIKDKLLTSRVAGEGEIRFIARGNYTVKGDTMKVVAFYRAGWTEHEAPTTTWTEYEVT